MSSDLRKKTRKRKVWVNDYTGYPRIKGQVEISTSRNGVFVGGDPDGLRSLAQLLTWIADVDQEALGTQPDGERFHVHLHARIPGISCLTDFSVETQLCRLDAKGTGEFPTKYVRRQRRRRGQKPP
jgi:hypothetical protein